MNIVSCWVCPICGSIEAPSISLTLDASLHTNVLADEVVTCGVLDPICYRAGIIMCAKCHNVVDAPVYDPSSHRAVRTTRYYLEITGECRFKVMCKVYEGDEV